MRKAAAAAQRAEPRVGELPGREGVVGAAGLDVAFDADHPLPELPVVAGLHAADDPTVVGLLCDVAPGVAEIDADIGTGPAVDVERLVDRVGRAGAVDVGRLR